MGRYGIDHGNTIVLDAFTGVWHTLTMKIKPLFLLAFVLSCAPVPDYSGHYYLADGDCGKKIVSLKKVQGFLDRYYTVTLRDGVNDRGTEFLGVIKGNIITIRKASIVLGKGSIRVTASGKDCLYESK